MFFILGKKTESYADYEKSEQRWNQYSSVRIIVGDSSVLLWLISLSLLQFSFISKPLSFSTISSVSFAFWENKIS